MSYEIPACHMAAPLPIQPPSNVPGRAVKAVQVPGALPSMWEMWMESQALDFGMTSPWPCGYLGVNQQIAGLSLYLSISLSLSLCKSAFQVNMAFLK